MTRSRPPAQSSAGASTADFDVRIAWRRDDPQIEADAVAFWNRLNILPPGVSPEDRAKDLVAAVYMDGKIVAVGTATLEWVVELRARFALLRGATDPDYRRRGAMWALAVPVRETLERWAIDHPEEKLAGRLGFSDPGAWGELAKVPVVPQSELMVFGYSANGHQIRGAWFDHFRFEDRQDGSALRGGDGPDRGEWGARAGSMTESEVRAMASGYDVHPAWCRNNRQFEEDAVAFWKRLGILPPGVEPEDRAKQLATVAYKDGGMVAVTTIGLGEVKQVRARLGMLRAAIDPEHRRTNLARALSAYTRDILERWSMEHPEERVAGMGTIVESANLRGLEKEPVWAATRLILIGYTPKGLQLRVTWFEDFRLD